MNFKRLLRAFEPSRRERDEERKHYESLGCSFSEVVSRAAMAETRTPGKMDPHQRRVGRGLLSVFARELIPFTRKLQRAKSFDELHNIVRRARVDGVGALTIFDTTLRIGFHRRMVPARVYLHAGAREGARLLASPVRGTTADVAQFPAALRVLDAHQIEHFLCVMKPAMRKGMSNSPASGRRRTC